jgi:superfamily II DNA or RNA helicase
VKGLKDRIHSVKRGKGKSSPSRDETRLAEEHQEKATPGAAEAAQEGTTTDGSPKAAGGEVAARKRRQRPSSGGPRTSKRTRKPTASTENAAEAANAAPPVEAAVTMERVSVREAPEPSETREEKQPRKAFEDPPAARVQGSEDPAAAFSAEPGFGEQPLAPAHPSGPPGEISAPTASAHASTASSPQGGSPDAPSIATPTQPAGDGAQQAQSAPRQQEAPARPHKKGKRKGARQRDKGPQGGKFRQAGSHKSARSGGNAQGASAKMRKKEKGLFAFLPRPLVPAGPSGLVYVIRGQTPLGGEGIIEVFERQEHWFDPLLEELELTEFSSLTPIPLDRTLIKKAEHPVDRQLAGLLLRLPRLRSPLERRNGKAANNGQQRGAAAGRLERFQGRRTPAAQAQLRALLERGRSKPVQTELALQEPVPCTCQVPEEMWKRLLPLLLESQRCYVEPRPDAETVPLVRETLPAYEFQLAIDFGNRGGEYHLTGRFVRDGKPLPPEAVVLLISEGEKGLLLRTSGRLSDLDFGGSSAWLRALRRGRFQRVSRRSLSKLYKVFERSTTLPRLHVPATLGVTTIEGELPRPELKLESGPQEVVGEVSFRYGDDLVRAARPGKCFFSTRTSTLIVRDLDAEARAGVRLLDLGFSYDRNTHNFHLSAEQLSSAALELFEYGWTITGKGMPFRPPSDMEVDITSGPDWIELSVTVHFGDQKVEVPALLEAIQQGNRMIPLGKGVVGVLPFEWLEKNAAWMALGEIHDGKLRFRRNQSSVVDALLSENIKARLDDGFKAERERLAGFKGIEPIPPSDEFRGKLRSYQELGLGWLRFLDQMGWGGCLADDMGLGKTIQALALLDLIKLQGRKGTTLVVTPKSLIFNWQREARRFTPKLKTTAYHGMKRSALLETLAEYDLVLTTYGTVRRDIEKLSNFRFLYLVLDEGQAIKNPDSQNARTAMLLQGERRLILSGTPVENHLGELWSLFNFLNPGMLGSASSFKKRFGSGRDADSASLKVLRRTLRPFILRRKKEEVAPDLPEKVEETILCEMESEQKKIYQMVREQCRNSVLARVRKSGVARSKLHILEALLRLRQAACHPGLVDDSKTSMPSGKFVAMLSMLEELQDEGHKVLIFSQFTSLLALLRKELESLGMAYEYLDGQTVDRQVRVDRFQQDPKIPFFLISLKAGGLGLNLTAADYVFILDPWWNPAVEAQAIDRAHRIGQEKKVFAYRFVSEDSIEERIADLQESKRRLADAIVQGSDSLLRDLTREELEFLFK